MVNNLKTFSMLIQVVWDVKLCRLTTNHKFKILKNEKKGSVLDLSL